MQIINIQHQNGEITNEVVHFRK